jgi:hypothetical protein
MLGCVKIGVQGLCSISEHNLNTYGISLNKVAKIADSAYTTGAKLVDDMVEEAWRNVYNDLQIDGFKLKGITETKKSKFINEYFNANTFSINFSTCTYESIKIKSLKIRVVGTLDIQLNINDFGLTGTYTDTDIDLTDVLNFDEDVTITLQTNGTGSIVNSNYNFPFEISMEKYCNEKLFYCEYSDWLIEAVKIKASALILNNALFSDRFNDFVLYNKKELSLRIGQLDSTLVQLENQKNGMYQNEIKSINRKLKEVVGKKKCQDCCFECSNIYETKLVMQ